MSFFKVVYASARTISSVTWIYELQFVRLCNEDYTTYANIILIDKSTFTADIMKIFNFSQRSVKSEWIYEVINSSKYATKIELGISLQKSL